MDLSDLDSSLAGLEKAGLVRGIEPTRLGEAAAAHEGAAARAQASSAVRVDRSKLLGW